MEALAVGGCTLIALALRFITAGLFSSGISTDEYRYAMGGQEWIRIVSGTSSLSFREILLHHPMVPVAAGIVSLLSGLDTLQAGRAVQLASNTATVPAVYTILRVVGMPLSGASAAALALAIIPGLWDASATFLPDSQLALASTLVFLGVVIGLRRSAWGMWLAAAALGAGFLTKEHLPIVLVPAIAVLLIAGTPPSPRRWWSIVRSGAVLGLGLGVAIMMGAYGLGIPRAILLAVIAGRADPPSPTDGLPPFAPSLDESTGGNWVSSFVNSIATGAMTLEWFDDAIGSRVMSTAVTVFGLVGSLGLAFTMLGSNRSTEYPKTIWARAAVFLGIAVPLTLFIAQLIVSPDQRAIGAATLIIVGTVAISRFRSKSSALWPKLPGSLAGSRLFWALLAAQSTYVVTTVWFFALRLEQVGFTPRMFLPILPACTTVFAVGCLFAGCALRPALERWSDALLVIVGGLVLALVVPGGPIRKAAVVLIALMLGAALYWPKKRELIPRAPALTMFAAFLALIVGTPTFSYVVRAREFRGYPDDPYYQRVGGGLRVASFRQSEPWLHANVRSADVIITSKPYQVGWHSGVGIAGFQRMRAWDELAADRRPFLSDDLLRQANFDWIIDFNQYAVQTQSPEGPAFEEDYRWLQSRPYLQEAHSVTDPQGRVLLYVFRHVRS